MFLLLLYSIIVTQIYITTSYTFRVTWRSWCDCGNVSWQRSIGKNRQWLTHWLTARLRVKKRDSSWSQLSLSSRIKCKSAGISLSFPNWSSSPSEGKSHWENYQKGKIEKYFLITCLWETIHIQLMLFHLNRNRELCGEESANKTDSVSGIGLIIWKSLICTNLLIYFCVTLGVYDMVIWFKYFCSSFREYN